LFGVSWLRQSSLSSLRLQVVSLLCTSMAQRSSEGEPDGRNAGSPTHRQFQQEEEILDQHTAGLRSRDDSVHRDSQIPGETRGDQPEETIHPLFTQAEYVLDSLHHYLDWVRTYVSVDAARRLYKACSGRGTAEDVSLVMNRFLSAVSRVSMTMHAMLADKVSEIQGIEQQLQQAKAESRDKSRQLQQRDQTLADLHLQVNERDRETRHLQQQLQ
jgi:hypothetical protein